MQQEKTAAIIANGTIKNPKNLASRVRSFSYLIAADGGLVHTDQMGLTPNLIIGDLDSAPETLLQKYASVPIQSYPQDKDETDVEIAIETAIAKGFRKIIIFGALEKRVDHTLYNLHLLTRYPEKISFESEYETLFVITKDQVIQCLPGQTISLLPIGEEAVGVTTKGLKWELHQVTCNSGKMSLSNIAIGESFSVSLQSGTLLISLCK